MSNRISKSVGNIVSDVRVCYDEIALNDANMIGDQDESELETIIKSKIGEAMEFVYGNCSESLLDGDDVSLCVTSANALETGGGRYVMKMDDVIGECLRLVWVKCSSWLYAVRDILSEGDKDATFIYDTYCGATWEKPAVMLSVGEDGKELHIVKPKSGDTVKVAYVNAPIASASESGGTASYSMNGKLYNAIKYYICSLVAITFGERERAKEFGEIAMGMMGAITKTEQ